MDFRKLYRQAADRQRQLARRWRRLSLVAAAAAILLLCLLGLRLQVRLERDQLVVSWGQEPVVEKTPQREKPQPQPKPVAPAPVQPESSFAADLKLLRELVHVLAADVERLDGKQEQELLLLRADLARLRALADERWATTELQFTTLTQTQFGQRKEEERP
jgi:hypothetical protein